MAVSSRIRIAPKKVLAVLLSSLAAAALVVVAMVLLGEYTKTRGRLLLTALSLAGFCVVALAPSALAQRDKYVLISAGGLVAAGLGFLLVTTGTWATPDSDAYWKAAGIVSVGAVSGSYLCWLLLFEAGRPPARAAWRIALVAAGLVLVLTCLGIGLEVKTAAFWWMVTGLTTAQLAGGLAVPALDRWALPLARAPRRSAGKLESSGEESE